MSRRKPEEDNFAGWAVAEEHPDRYVLQHPDGGKLGVRIMDLADTLDLMELAGTESSNQGWMNLAAAICSVSHVDGLPVPYPTSKEDIKARVRELGNVKMAAVIWVLFNRKPPDPQKTVETAKN